MQRFLAFAFLLAACGGKTSTPTTSNTAPEEQTTTAGEPAATAEPLPASDSFPNLCCCIQGGESGIAWEGEPDCAGGVCTRDQSAWTETCSTEAMNQEIADERARADESCPSGDRHDCDGDGTSEWDDSDDENPDVQ